MIPRRRAAIERVIQTIKDEFLDLEQLKTPESVQLLRSSGVPGGIALLVSKRVSEFKTLFKRQQQVTAAEGLVAVGVPQFMSNPHPPFQSISSLRNQIRSTGGEQEDEFVWGTEVDFFDDI